MIDDAGPQNAEHIEPGRDLHLLDTPLGTITVGICRDFCEASADIADIWQSLSPALVLVPSMGCRSTLNAHDRQARDLAPLHGTATVVAQQPPGTCPDGFAPIGKVWPDNYFVDKGNGLYDLPCSQD
jgi:hypothetical protein